MNPITNIPAPALLAAGLLLVSLCATAQPVQPQAANAPTKTGAKAGETAAKVGETAADTTLFWYDGGRRRALSLDSSQLADFRRSAKDAIRPAGDVEKSVGGALPKDVSPVLRNADAPPSAIRALPGGVLITLKTLPRGDDAAHREAQAREELQRLGLEPMRAIDPAQRIWLVASAPGLASLELANRLHESGAFEAATPNWWLPRALK